MHVMGRDAVTASIANSAYEDGITAPKPAVAYGGLSIKPRVIYTFMPGLNAYAELWITNLGADDPLKVGIAPQIGGSFSF
jgi:hypothetical protein